MSTAFTRLSGARASAAHGTTDAGFPPRSVPTALRRLRPSQQPVAEPIRGAVIPAGAMRPSRIALAGVRRRCSYPYG